VLHLLDAAAVALAELANFSEVLRLHVDLVFFVCGIEIHVSNALAQNILEC